MTTALIVLALFPYLIGVGTTYALLTFMDVVSETFKLHTRILLSFAWPLLAIYGGAKATWERFKP